MSTYYVKSGDTLSGIASRNGLSLAQIRAFNPQISNPNVIRVGQLINLSNASGLTAAGFAAGATNNNYGVVSWGGNSQATGTATGTSGIKGGLGGSFNPVTVPVVSVKPSGQPQVTPITVDPANSTVPATKKTAEQKISDFAHGIGVSVSVLGVLGLLVFVVLSKRD